MGLLGDVSTSIFFCLFPLPEHESRLAGRGKLKDDVEALAVFVHPGRADLCPEVFKDLEKDRMEMAWRNRIEELSDLIVARDRLDAEKRV